MALSHNFSLLNNKATGGNAQGLSGILVDEKDGDAGGVDFLLDQARKISARRR